MLRQHLTQPLLGAEVLVFLYVLVSVSQILSLAFNSDLGKIPGPFISRFTGLSLRFAVLRGRRSAYIHGLHKRYEIAIADINGWRKIHKVGSEFNKGPWYQRQVPQQNSDETAGVFAILDDKKASARRKMFQIAGTRKIVQEWEPMIIRLTEMTISQVQEELKTGSVDIMKWWSLMTSDVLGEVAFGKPFDNVKLGMKSHLVRDIENAMPHIGLRIELPWISFLFELFAKIFVPSMKFPWTNLVSIGKQAVIDTKTAIREGNKTLFSKMINESDPQKMIPDHVIEQEAANLLVAGTDTTAMFLTYFTFEVLKDRIVHQKLIDECETLREHPSWEELEALPYLKNVITETLRLHPSVPGSLARIVPQGGEDFGKYIIPAGTQVATQALTFHLDANVYEDPLKFNPGRWDDANAAMKEQLMTFGGPARLCLGQNIARLQILHASFQLFRNCPYIRLAPFVTDESMEFVDFFAIKPKRGCMEIVCVQD